MALEERAGFAVWRAECEKRTGFGDVMRVWHGTLQAADALHLIDVRDEALQAMRSANARRRASRIRDWRIPVVPVPCLMLLLASTVSAGGRLVAPAGTGFSVEMSNGGARAVLYEGLASALEAAPGDARPLPVRLATRRISAQQVVTSGVELVTQAGMPLATIPPMDLEPSPTWAGRAVTFAYDPRSGAIERISRYPDQRSATGDAAAGRMLVSGAFNPSGTAGFVDAATRRPSVGRRPPTVEDMLSQEGYGGAKFSPNGRWLAINLIPRYSDLDDYSYSLSAFWESGHQVWVADLARGGDLYRLEGLDRFRTSHIVAFSPASEYLIVLQYYLGEYNFASCHLSTGRCRRYPLVPDLITRNQLSTAWNFRLIWTSNKTFVFPMRPAGASNPWMRNRAAIGRMLWGEWNRAWTGNGSTASEVISTARRRSNEWGEGSLTEFDIASGRVRTLADGRYAGARLSPDRRWLVAAREGVHERSPSETPSASNRESRPVFDRRFSLRLIDLQSSRQEVVVTPDNGDPSSITWCPNGRDFAVFGWNDGQTSADGRFYIVNARTGEWSAPELNGLMLANRWNAPELDYLSAGPARAVLLDDGLIVFAKSAASEHYDWYLIRKGRRPANLTAGLKEISDRPSYVDRNSFVVQARGGVFRIDLRSPKLARSLLIEGNVVDLRHSINDSGSVTFRPEFYDVRSEFDSHSYFLCRKDGRSRIVFVNFVKPRGGLAEFQVSLDSAEIVTVSMSAASAVLAVKNGYATRFELRRLRDRRVDVLAVINAHLAEIEAPLYEEFDYRLRDPNAILPDRAMKGCLQLPVDYEMGMQYPILVEIYPVSRHGCPKTSGRRIGRSDLWRSRGFVYLMANMPLDLVRNDNGPMAGMDEVLNQTVETLRERGVVDPSRIVLAGFSQGGIGVLYIASQTEVASAVIAQNGWADFLSHYFGARGLYRYEHLGDAEADNRWRYECSGTGPEDLCPFGFEGSPFDATAAFVENSPVTLARGITAPVLLVHSDFDYFDMSQFDEMFGALSRAGKEVRYVRYWGEGHGPSSPDNIRDLWSRIDQFLADAGIYGGARRER